MPCSSCASKATTGGLCSTMRGQRHALARRAMASARGCLSRCARCTGTRQWRPQTPRTACVPCARPTRLATAPTATPASAVKRASVCQAQPAPPALQVSTAPDSHAPQGSSPMATARAARRARRACIARSPPVATACRGQSALGTSPKRWLARLPPTVNATCARPARDWPTAHARPARPTPTRPTATPPLFVDEEEKRKEERSRNKKEKGEGNVAEFVVIVQLQ